MSETAARSQTSDKETRSLLEQVILPLIAVTSDAAWHPVGTAFVVRGLGDQALIMTATHNLKYVVKLDQRDRPSQSAVCPAFRIEPQGHIQLRKTQYYVGVEGEKGFVLAPVIQSWHLNECDVAIAVAQLEPDSGGRFSSQIVLDTTPAKIGESVNAIGYCGMSSQNESDYEREHFKVTFTKRLEGRAGKIVNVARQGLGIHKWPGFVVDFPLDSGMSGGPVLVTGGNTTVARAVIGGDISEDPDPHKGSGAQAFASMLWPVLATPLDLKVMIQDQKREVSIERVIDLVRIGVIQDRGDSLARFRYRKAESGEILEWSDDSGSELIESS